MTTGEGGIVTTHSEELWQLLKSLRNHGRSYDARWFNHVRLGFNYRISDVQAALGLAQLERLDEILTARDRAAARYGELLAGIDGVEVPHPDDDEHVRSWFVYVVKLDRGLDRDFISANLGRARGGGGPLRPVRPSAAVPAGAVRVPRGHVPVAEDAATRTLALPFFTDITEDDQAYVADVLADVVRR